MGQLHSVYNGFISLGKSSSFLVRSLLFGGKELLKQPNTERAVVAPPAYTLQSLPVEVLLHIFSQLELESYIISHGVCKDWRRLLPLADIHPVRRRLFDLYHNMINTPNFVDTRSWILDNLQPFDRQAHVNALLAQYPAIPEEYRIWVLEWPARAVIACTWPGLPFMDCHNGGATQRHGVNWLAYKRESPELMAPIYKHGKPEVRFIPALLVWRSSYITEWISFDTDEPALFGRVYTSDVMEADRSAAIPDRLWSRDEAESFQDTFENIPSTEPYTSLGAFHPDWINYLEYHWAFTVKHISYANNSYPIRDRLISEEQVTTEFNKQNARTRPTCPWNVRHLHTAYLYFS